MQMYSDKLMFTHAHIENAQTHALPTKSLLHHLLTHIHNVFLSPAAHQGLGKLPGMKEICSLMAPFRAYGGTRHSWRFFWSQGEEFHCRKAKHSEEQGFVSCVPIFLGCALSSSQFYSVYPLFIFCRFQWQCYGLCISCLLVKFTIYSFIFFSRC